MKKWSNSELKIIKKKYGNELTKTIAKQLNRSVASIVWQARKMKLKGNPSKTRRIYNIDLNYFNKINLENSYWAGFLAADGCVSKGKKNRIRLKLSNKDYNHLLKFKNCCKSNNKIYKFKQKNKFYCSFETCNKIWVEDLNKNFNITPNKTFTLKPPDLSFKNSLAFIRGYIDGDGCVYQKNGSSKIIICIAGNLNILKWIKNKFDILTPIFSGANVRKIKNKKSYQYTISGQKAIKIATKLIRLNTPNLKRKWDKCMII